ncbi:hypothetical protein BDZ97DRAFT_1857816 [Flammula alnicola]|nr:hypothetical protein BDZ97DRAFT_1857816 [Flammula alnicola]
MRMLVHCQFLYLRKLTYCNPKATSFPPGLTLSNLSSPRTEEDRIFMKDRPYREVLSSLMWASSTTPWDLFPCQCMAASHPRH